MSAGAQPKYAGPVSATMPATRDAIPAERSGTAKTSPSRPTGAAAVPGVDLVRERHDAAGGRLAVHLGERDVGHLGRHEQVAQHGAAPDRRQLVGVADQQHARAVGHAPRGGPP